MGKKIKKPFIIASILMVTGMIIFIGVMISIDWKFDKLTTQEYVTNTYDMGDDFEKINIEVDMSDIEFVLSEDKKCSVVCYETEGIKHSVKVEDNTLVIKSVDERKWYEHIGIFVESPKVKIYLPKNEFASIDIETEIGDISMKNLVVDNNIEIETDTGDISVERIIVNGNFEIETDTGDVRFDKCDANEISVNTSTGDVSGTLLTEKIFVTKTSTGEINVPNTTTGGKCEIKTSTGDIDIVIQ